MQKTLVPDALPKEALRQAPGTVRRLTNWALAREPSCKWKLF